jgi:autotransporter-associated beta strand protein
MTDGSYFDMYGGEGAEEDGFITAGTGGSANLSVAGSVSIDNSEVDVEGGEGGYGYGFNGGNGGNASVSIGSNLTLTDGASLEVYGGEGDRGGHYNYGTGGSGGSAVLSVAGAVSIDDSAVTVEGGKVYGSYSSGAAGTTEGSGGNAMASLGSLTLTGGSYFEEYGGSGGNDRDSANGGNGGSAVMNVAGSVSIDNSEVDVDGGAGGYSNSANGGNGGNASASIGSNLTLTNDASLYVAGGDGNYAYGDDGSGLSGSGGSASLVISGAVSMDNSYMEVDGGYADEGEGTRGQTETAGGNASVSIGSNLTLTSDSELDVYGEDGAADYEYANGGNGGSANLSVAGAVSMDNSQIYVDGGSGGYSSSANSGSGGTASISIGPSLTLTGDSYLEAGGAEGDEGYGLLGTTEGAGGNANLFVGANMTLISGSEVEVYGGEGAEDYEYSNGGNGGSASLTVNGAVSLVSSAVYVTGGDGGYAEDTNGGNGGNATLTVGSLSLDAASTISVCGGEGGSGHLSDGTAGTAVARIGTLTGAGYITMGGSSASLQVSNGNFSGTIDGTEDLEKVGTGLLTLTGVNTYTGGTTVSGGTLAVGGVSALGTGLVAVTGGTLGTDGVLHTINAASYYQGTGGTLQLGLGGTAASDYDKLAVSGAATLSGNLNLCTFNGFKLEKDETFTLITAGSLNGAFSNVPEEVHRAAVSVVYDRTDDEVILDVLATAPSFASVGLTGNQGSIGAALDALAGQSGNSALINYLNNQTNASLPEIYQQLSPSNLTPLYHMGFTTAQIEAGMVGHRLAGLFGGSSFSSTNVSWNGESPRFAGNLPASEEAAMVQELQPERWSVFATGLDNFGTVTGDSNGPGYQFSTGGLAAGLDYRFSKEWVGGLLIGYTQSGTSQSTGSVNVSGGQLGVYGGWKQDSLHVNALVEGGNNNYTTQRPNALGGAATGTTNGQEISAQLGVGYDLNMDKFKLGPFVSGQYTSVNINAFNETGSLAPLDFSTQSEDYYCSDMGAVASRAWDLGGMSLTPSVSAAWEHIYQGNVDSLNASLGSGADFTVNGSTMGTDALVLGVGLNAQFNKSFNAFASYQGKVGLTNYTEQGLSGGVNFGF